MVSYDGETISSLSGMKLVNIGLNLVNSVGENLYTQLVTVVPDPEEPSTADNSNSALDAET